MSSTLQEDDRAGCQFGTQGMTGLLATDHTAVLEQNAERAHGHTCVMPPSERELAAAPAAILTALLACTTRTLSGRRDDGSTFCTKPVQMQWAQPPSQQVPHGSAGHAMPAVAAW